MLVVISDYKFSANGLNAFLGRRDSVICPNIRVSSTEWQHLPSGFYWTSSIENVITGNIKNDINILKRI